MANELERISKNTDAIHKDAEQQQKSMERIGSNIKNAIDTQTFAIVASSQALTRSFGVGFDSVNNMLDMGFSGVSNQLGGVSNQLGYMTASFSIGFDRITSTLQYISKDICDRLDAIQDIVNNPRLTEARELYRSAVVHCNKGFFEEAVEDLKAALGKTKTDYISWFLLGEVYLFGKGKFCNVIDLDASIDALTSAAKYIDPEIATSTEATLMASEIWFYLGLAKYKKCNDLRLQGQKAEAKAIIEGALQAFEEAFGLSKNMLEARYNAAKCKALVGNAKGALADLHVAITKDRNYCLKMFADSDFNSIKDQCSQLVDQLKCHVFAEAEPKYNRIRTLVKELEELGGYCNESVPQELPESLPYFDILDYNAVFDSSIPRIENAIEKQKGQNQRNETERQEQLRRAEQERLERERRAEQKRRLCEQRKKVKDFCFCISAGNSHTVGLGDDGKVIAAGGNTEVFYGVKKRNDYGQCNTSGWRSIISVSAGCRHTVGLKADGTVVAVGHNKIYDTQKSTFVHCGQCDTKDWRDIIEVSAGAFYTVGLKADGTVVAIGDNEEGQCNTGNWCNIISVSAARTHTIGLKSDGTVIAVGRNIEGQCKTNGWRDIVAIAAGYRHTVGLKADGTVVAIGDNETYNAQLEKDVHCGQCDTNGWNDIIAISAGSHHTVGLKSDGTVVAIGNDIDYRGIGYGQCNTGNWREILAIAAGDSYTVGLKSDGTVVAVGSNIAGQCNIENWRNINPVSEECRKRMRIESLCQYCGGQIGGFFGKKCKSCGKPV